MAEGKAILPINLKRRIFLPLEKPLNNKGHLQILYGNLAEKGSGKNKR